MSDEIIDICERCNFKEKRETNILSCFFKKSENFKIIDNIKLCKQCYRHFIVIFDKFMENKV